MSSLDYLELCRLCLVKDRVSVPIFEGEGDVRQIFLKIAACLPVKVSRGDKLPKKICDDCAYKVELFYQFWNTTANAEKQLLEWLGEVGLQDKQDYITDVLDPGVLKQEQTSESRLDGNVMQQVNVHESNMGIGMMENMDLGMPMVLSSTDQQRMAPVPMDTRGSSVQNVQTAAGSSAHEQMQTQTSTSARQDEEEESSEDEENSEEECDAEEGLPVKEENEEEHNSRAIEPTTFVNVSLACDEAGPSGLQQQKITEMPEIALPQTAEGDSKSGSAQTPGTAKSRTIVQIRGNPSLATKCQALEVAPGVIKILMLPEATGEKALTRRKEESNRTAQREVVEPAAKEPAAKEPEEDIDVMLKKLRNTCPFCDKQFKDEKKVESHVRTMHKRPFKCDMCRKSYCTPHVLERHRKIHNSNFFFECSVCLRKYKREEGLKQHHARVHSDLDAKFMCDHCGRRYKLKNDLLMHISRTHSVNPQVCRYCGKTVNDLKNHEWRHLKRAKKVHFAYACHLCTKEYRTQTKLDNHLLIHKQGGYKCEECNIEFEGPSKLKSHKYLKHKPGKTCTICGKVFASSANFYQHVLTHGGIRPYECDVCGEDFTQRSSMLRHRRSHPGSLPPLETKIPIASLARSVLQKR